MHRAGHQLLRTAWTRPSRLLPVEIVSIPGLQCQSKRGMANPLSWFRDRLNPVGLTRDQKEEELARKADEEKGQGSLFDALPKLIEKQDKQEVMKTEKSKKTHTEHKSSTGVFKISHRKLNLLARQIAGKPVDHAVLQMQFSSKRAAKRVKSTLNVARLHAEEYKNMDKSKLVVSQAWVTKHITLKRIEIKGRGKTGVRKHFYSKLTVVLQEGKTLEEKARLLRAKRLNRIRSPGLMREDKPLVNVAPRYAW